MSDCEEGLVGRWMGELKRSCELYVMFSVVRLCGSFSRSQLTRLQHENLWGNRRRDFVA